MKSKKSLYILIPLVVFIWGIIIFRVVDMSQSDSDVVSNDLQLDFTLDTVTFQELHPLKLNYRDPFLRTLPKKKTEEKTNNGSIFYTNPEPEKKVVNWPKVIFKGKVVADHMVVAILTIDGKKEVVNRNQVIDEMQLIKIYNDSIVLRKEGELRTFIK